MTNRKIKFKDIEIVPSLLSADFARLAGEVDRVERAGCRILHLDVMDGHFVPNITFGPVVARAVRAVTGLYLDAHLMIEDPGSYLEAFRESGVDGITIHREIKGDYRKVLRMIREMDLAAGVCLRPATPVESIEDALEELDFILIMSVEPGFGGQVFMPGSIARIKRTREMLLRHGLRVPIGVDGGINLATAPRAARAGAARLIAGSAVFRGDVVSNIRALRESVEKAGTGRANDQLSPC
jgi:ribulose-phosphate 3-epimerase